MAPAPSYAPLSNALVNSYLYVLPPATPNALNVVSLVIYVVGTLGLTYYAYAGGPDMWALCLPLYGLIVFTACFLSVMGGELLDRHQHTLLPT